MNALRLPVLIAVLPVLLLCAVGCGEDASAKPKVVKGGLDPDKAEKQKEYKMEFSR